MYEQVSRALEGTLQRWQELKSKDIPALNQKLRQSGAPALNAEKAAALETIWDRDKDAVGVE
jgi:hypothetical protein